MANIMMNSHAARDGITMTSGVTVVVPSLNKSDVPRDCFHDLPAQHRRPVAIAHLTATEAALTGYYRKPGCLTSSAHGFLIGEWRSGRPDVFISYEDTVGAFD